MRILLAQINPTVGDLEGNCKKILQSIAKAKEKNAEIVLFPELCLTGYPPEDLLLLPHFIDALEQPLSRIASACVGVTAIVGTPRKNESASEKPLYDSAAILSEGKVVGFQDKILLPTYDLFDERRYFEPGGPIKLWPIAGKKIAITICEDLWQHSQLLTTSSYLRDPVLELKEQRPDFVLNLSASPFSIFKAEQRLLVGKKAAATLKCPILFCNQVGGNDGIIFDGRSLFLDGNGTLLDTAAAFKEEHLLVDLGSPVRRPLTVEEPSECLFSALVLGVQDYFKKLGFSRACLGISGGIDSAVVAAIAVEALGNKNVLGISMPSRYTSTESREDAAALAERLGIALEEIPIEGPFSSYLDLLQPQFNSLPHDSTEENIQARIRGMILMAISNKFGRIVLSTGNKSELAMGYTTLYGDMCGGLGVLSDVTKKQVYAIAKWINRNKELIPQRTIQKPPSAELRFGQKDSDTLPDYDIIDNVLEGYVEEHRSPEAIAHAFGYSLPLVNDLISRIHQNEYKRRQSPPGIRVTEKSFSFGRRFPIVQKWV